MSAFATGCHGGSEVNEVLAADASPEKRLFISLLTRDIPLVAAFLDLVDNSINAAAEPYAGRLKTAHDYLKLKDDPKVKPSASISLEISDQSVVIVDTATGISAQTAKDHVFKFGRGDEPASVTDRLSVYGIGLKRAIFKLGNVIHMRSDHVDGGFDLALNVSEWSKVKGSEWTFKITKRDPVPAGETGTTITVTELYDEVKRRVNDGVFDGQLRDAISRTYSYYLGKLVTISLNDEQVEGTSIDLSENHATKQVKINDVTCTISAGLGVPVAGKYREKSSGWFVFCNGRAVVSADKTALTGWGGGAIPIFQPKHRPFLGTVFFVAEDPEKLPWTTTKSGINEDSSTWQTAKREMAAVGREVVSYLDSRYSDVGTEVDANDLQTASGPERVSVLAAAVAKPKAFKTPKRKVIPTVKIQYDALMPEVEKIAKHLKKPGMSGSDVGRHTFNYFLRNEVGET